MSAKIFSRAFEQGQIKQLSRMKQSVTLALPVAQTPRNPVAYALAQRRASSAAGKHIRKRGAERRAQTVALQQATKGGRWSSED